VATVYLAYLGTHCTKDADRLHCRVANSPQNPGLHFLHVYQSIIDCVRKPVLVNLVHIISASIQTRLITSVSYHYERSSENILLKFYSVDVFFCESSTTVCGCINVTTYMIYSIFCTFVTSLDSWPMTMRRVGNSSISGLKYVKRTGDSVENNLRIIIPSL